MRVLVGFLGFFSVVAFGTSSVMVDTREFFKGVEGQYEILKVVGDGVKKPDGALFDVFVDADVVSLTAPYCQVDDGVCIAGYIDLEVGKTTVAKNSNGVFSIVTQVGKDLHSYSWTESGGVVTFHNAQSGFDHQIKKQ